jgi:hypothetical protein
VRAVEAGEALPVPARVRREVVNYFAALRHIEKQAAKKRLAHEDVLRLHGIVAGEVMDQGEAGRYRTLRVQVGTYVPPAPEQVPGLMLAFLEWWNDDALERLPEFGREAFDHRGGVVLYFDMAARATRAARSVIMARILSITADSSFSKPRAPAVSRAQPVIALASFSI